MKSHAVVATLSAILSLAVSQSWAVAEDDDFVEVPGLGETRIDVPRPSSGGSSCVVALPIGSTIADRASGLRAAGLFADRASLSDGSLAMEVEAGIATDWGAMAPDDPLAELIVAEQDRSRVWWRDLEADVWSGGAVYESTLEEWEAISVGAFAPTDVAEDWASETGPITVAFEMGGTSHILNPGYLEDWIDPRILEPIEDLIAASGRQFRMVAPFDQTAFVMALTSAEKAALEVRGWCFT